MLCIEELDPVIEKELNYICGKFKLNTKVYGKLTHHVKNAGENSRDSVAQDIGRFLGNVLPESAPPEAPPELPVRPAGFMRGLSAPGVFFCCKRGYEG